MRPSRSLWLVKILLYASSGDENFSFKAKNATSCSSIHTSTFVFTDISVFVISMSFANPLKNSIALSDPQKPPELRFVQSSRETLDSLYLIRVNLNIANVDHMPLQRHTILRERILVYLHLETVGRYVLGGNSNMLKMLLGYLGKHYNITEVDACEITHLHHISYNTQ